MKNKVCWPFGLWYEMFIPRAQLMSCPVKPYFSYHVPLTQFHSHASTLRAHKPYFSYHVPSTQLRSHASVLRPTNLISHTIFSNIPSTQLHSHASILQPTNLIFHTTFRQPRFILMQAPFGPQTLFLIPFFRAHIPSTQLYSHAKHPSTHKPYFSYQLFERMPRPIDPDSFPYKLPLNFNHPVHRTFLI